MTDKLIEHVEHFEFRYKRSYDKYMKAMAEFSVGGCHDEQILNAIAFCECQRIGKYIKEEVLTANEYGEKLKKTQAQIVDRIMDFGVSDRLPDINSRVERIVAKDLLELLDNLIANI